MRLRVLDDDRPGYAQLAFDSPLSELALEVSVRSLREGAFLGPDGKWQRSAHFFTASRISGDDRSARYRVGPEIVNFLLDLDLVEFAAADGSFRLETTWENATPQLTGKAKGISIYQEGTQPPQPRPRAPASVPTPQPSEPLPSQPEPSPERPEFAAPPPEPLPPERPVMPRMPAAPPLTVPPPPPLEPEWAEEVAGEEEYGEAPPPDDGAGGGDGFFARHKVLVRALAGLVGVVVLGLGLYLFRPCGMLGKTDCVLPAEREAAEKAQLCVSIRKDDGRDCEVAKDCVAPYLAGFPDGPARANLEEKAKAADDNCQQMEEMARGALQCIDDLKAQHRACVVQAACVQSFQALYHSGPQWNDVDQAARQAKIECDSTAPPPGEDDALRKARQCAADPAHKCESPACYDNYSNVFGLNGIHKDEAQREAIELDRVCTNILADKPDDTAFAAAQECAKGPQRCATPRCFESYLSQFGKDGKHHGEAQAEAAKIDAECRIASEEANLWNDAKSCATTAAACAVKTCYKPYTDRFGATGKHSADAQREIARAEEACSQPPKPPRPGAIDGGMVAIGDTYEDVKRAFGDVKTPTECKNASKSCSTMLRLDDRGIWLFFDAQGKIYTMRFGRPWDGSVRGIRIGDPSNKIESLLGTPNGTDGPNAGSGPYYYEVKGSRRYVYRKDGVFIASYTLDSSSKVETIFVP
jgi:hypothetical protein